MAVNCSVYRKHVGALSASVKPLERVHNQTLLKAQSPPKKKSPKKPPLVVVPGGAGGGSGYFITLGEGLLGRDCTAKFRGYLSIGLDFEP